MLQFAILNAYDPTKIVKLPGYTMVLTLGASRNSLVWTH